MNENYPPLEQLNFPYWMICVCDSNEHFDEGRKILIEKFKYIPSPIEEGSKDQALVLPRSDLYDLEERLKSENPDTRGWGWGRGRARFRTKFRGKSSVGFKYFLGDCPWEQIKDNPMKDAVKEVVNLLNPIKYLNHKGKEIQFPY